MCARAEPWARAAAGPKRDPPSPTARVLLALALLQGSLERHLQCGLVGRLLLLRCHLRGRRHEPKVKLHAAAAGHIVLRGEPGLPVGRVLHVGRGRTDALASEGRGACAPPARAPASTAPPLASGCDAGQGASRARGQHLAMAAVVGNSSANVLGAPCCITGLVGGDN